MSMTLTDPDLGLSGAGSSSEGTYLARPHMQILTRTLSGTLRELFMSTYNGSRPLTLGPGGPGCPGFPCGPVGPWNRCRQREREREHNIKLLCTVDNNSSLFKTSHKTAKFPAAI